MKSHDDSASEVHGALFVRLRHQTEDLAVFSQLLDMPTSYNWLASDTLHRGPNLPPRLRGESCWASKVILFQREFCEVLSCAVDRLLSQRSALEAFQSRGGTIELYLQFNGRMNTGDAVTPALIRSIALVGAELHVEVFPKFSA
jgi:hypothetical protein